MESNIQTLIPEALPNPAVSPAMTDLTMRAVSIEGRPLVTDTPDAYRGPFTQ